MSKPNVKHPISRYLNIRQANYPTFFSDGQRIAFLTDLTGVPQVWQVRLPAKPGQIPWPDQLTFEADRVMGVLSSRAAGDGRLIYASDVGGSENAQLFLLDPETAREVPLTAGYENAMHIPGEWSEDGTQLLFAANRRQPALFDLYVQPLDGAARLVWQNEQPGFLFHQVFSPDGGRATVSRMSSSFEHDLFEIDLATGAARQLNPPGLQARYGFPCYAPDGRSLYLNTDLESDFTYIARLDLETRAFEPLVQQDWDIQALTLSPDGRYLAYTVNVEGADELHLLDLVRGGSREAPGLESIPGVVAMMEGQLAFAPDASRLVFSFTSSTRTSDIYLWDLASDQVYPVTQSSHGGLPPDSFVAPELVRYPTFDGRHIPAWLYKPAGQAQEPMPVVVYVHGGPEAQFRPSFNFAIQHYVHRGYAVLAPNVRGSTGYGKAYSHLDDVRKRMDSVADAAYAARWLREQPGFDGERLAVVGGSYGGFMVLASLTAHPELWAAGVDVVGMSSLVTFLENTSAYRRAHREAEYGSLERDREFLESIAPINNVDKITAPLIVIHGANDPRVPLSETEQLVAALEARDVPVEFLVFDDEGHGIVKLKNKLVAYPAMVGFLDKHLSRVDAD